MLEKLELFTPFLDTLLALANDLPNGFCIEANSLELRIDLTNVSAYSLFVLIELLNALNKGSQAIAAKAIMAWRRAKNRKDGRNLGGDCASAGLRQPPRGMSLPSVIVTNST
jgi:hypothetical protein